MAIGTGGSRFSLFYKTITPSPGFSGSHKTCDLLVGTLSITLPKLRGKIEMKREKQPSNDRVWPH